MINLFIDSDFLTASLTMVILPVKYLLTTCFLIMDEYEHKNDYDLDKGLILILTFFSLAKVFGAI